MEAVPGVEHVVQGGHLLPTHTASSLVWRAPPSGGEESFKEKGHHLVAGADALLAVKFAHSGKLDEAVVVKVVVDAQMVAVPEEE